MAIAKRLALSVEVALTTEQPHPIEPAPFAPELTPPDVDALLRAPPLRLVSPAAEVALVDPALLAPAEVAALVALPWLLPVLALLAPLPLPLPLVASAPASRLGCPPSAPHCAISGSTAPV